MKLNLIKFVIWAAMIMAVSLMITALLLVFSGDFQIATEELNQAKMLEAEGINKINIDTVSTNINIIKSEGDKIKVNFYGEVSSNIKREKPELAGYVSGDNLYIEIIQPKGIYFGINILRTKLDIYIPDKIFDSFAVGTSSADLKIKGISAREFSCDNISGDFDVERLIARNIKLDTTSGDIKLSNYKGNLEIKSISGDILLDEGVGNEKIKIKTTSGDIKIEQDKTSNMDIETISGNLIVLLNQGSEFELAISTISGNIKNEFPIKLTPSNEKELEGEIGEGGDRIIVDTTSGDIKIGVKR